MAITLGLCALPMLLACGAAVDYSRQITLKTQFDSIADAVALQAVDFAAMNMSTEKAQAAAAQQFTTLAQANGIGTVDALTINLSNDSTGRVSSISYTASVPPSVTGIIGIQKLSISGTSTAHSAGATYLDIYILADNTPSMGLAATTSGMSTMQNLTANATTAAGYEGSCAFACHITGSNYDYFTIARNAGITTRIDSVRNAVNGLLDTAKTATTSYMNFRFAMYTFGPDASTMGLTNIYPLSSDLTGAKAATSAINLMSTPYNNYKSNGLTDFTSVVYGMNSVIPNSGNGQSQALSRKLMFFVSDGLDDRLGVNCAQPMEHAPRCIDFLYSTQLCDNLKARGITIATIYTTYLPIPNYSYYTINVDPINKGPYSPSPNSLIAQRMQACATTGYYQEVGPNDSISVTVNLMFNQFVNQSARITG